MQNLAIDPSRLWNSVMETARFGAASRGGIRRLCLTSDDKDVRDWLARAVRELGCDLTVDSVGNMFALRPGRRADLPPIAIGSHLDTQPTGGKFDGVLGVLGALEILRTLEDLGVRTEAPLMLVNWTNEEGSRFAPAMLGSGVHAGVFDQAFADLRMDRDGATFGSALDAIGYRGAAAVGSVKLGAYFELHIEQGPILEAEDKQIGVVTGVQGMRWWDLEIGGREAHTGSTPMTMRRNALLGAARAIETIEAIARAHPPGVGTVGQIECLPNSRNVIPGLVRLSVDFRHPEDGALDEMQAELEGAVADIAQATDVRVDLTSVWTSPAVQFDAACVEAVRRGAGQAGYSSRDIVSGAGHDAAYLARVVPTAMVFVPCAGGLSHNEAELTSFEECARGAQALLNAVLAYEAERRN